MATENSVKLNNRAVSMETFTRKVSSLTKNVDKFGDQITDVASIAVAHAALHSNLNPLILMFNSFRLNNGKLNKQGRLIKSYVSTFYKALAFDKQDNVSFKLVRTPVSGGDKGEYTMEPISVTARGLYIVGKGENGRPEKADIRSEGHVYKGLPNYNVWVNSDLNKTEEKAKPTITASAIKRSVHTLADKIKEFKGMATPEQWESIRADVNAILEATYPAVINMSAGTDVDVDQSAIQGGNPNPDPKADNLVNTPIGGKKGIKVHESARGKVASI